jgi:hypothetical protein
LGHIEHKQLVVRGRWAKEGVEIDLNLNSERGGAGGMVDSKPGIIRENEGISSQGFPTVWAPLRETRNACPKTMFVVHDEHLVVLLSSELLLEPKRSTVQCRQRRRG